MPWGVGGHAAAIHLEVWVCEEELSLRSCCLTCMRSCACGKILVLIPKLHNDVLFYGLILHGVKKSFLYWFCVYSIF